MNRVNFINIGRAMMTASQTSLALILSVTIVQKVIFNRVMHFRNYIPFCLLYIITIHYVT